LGWWCPYYPRQTEGHQETMASLVVFTTNYITLRNAEKINYNIYIIIFLQRKMKSILEIIFYKNSEISPGKKKKPGFN
jgi:hypothetical protein